MLCQTCFEWGSILYHFWTQASINLLPYLLWASIVINNGDQAEQFFLVLALIDNIKQAGGSEQYSILLCPNQGETKTFNLLFGCSVPEIKRKQQNNKEPVANLLSLVCIGRLILQPAALECSV